jgi:hypothetical protein
MPAGDCSFETSGGFPRNVPAAPALQLNERQLRLA